MHYYRPRGAQHDEDAVAGERRICLHFGNAARIGRTRRRERRGQRRGVHLLPARRSRHSKSGRERQREARQPVRGAPSARLLALLQRRKRRARHRCKTLYDRAASPTFHIFAQALLALKPSKLESALLVYCTCIQGKIEMELELLTAEEAAAKPAGRSRDEPNQNPTLLEPKCARPAPPVASGHLSSTLFSVHYYIYCTYEYDIYPNHCTRV